MQEPLQIALRIVDFNCLERLRDLLRIKVEADKSKTKLDKQYARDMDELKNDCPSLSFILGRLEGDVNPRPLYSIIRIVTLRYKCFAIVEHPYLDLEEWDNYCISYAKSFTQYHRASHRMHFFDAPDNKSKQVYQALLKGKNERAIRQLGARYRGFVVIGPTRSFIVGRTALEFDRQRPPETPKATELDPHPLERTGDPYCTCAIPQVANVCSAQLTVHTAPSIQQSPALGMCTTASVWVADQIMGYRFGLQRFPYGSITQQGAFGRSAPTTLPRVDLAFGRGLTTQEIADALAQTGANPLLLDAQHQNLTQARLRLLAYTLVESGLPVILCFETCSGKHAVTLVGHLLPGGDGKDQAESDFRGLLDSQKLRYDHHVLGCAVQLYYAHDDAYGPFHRIRFVSDREKLDAVRQRSVPSEVGMVQGENTSRKHIFNDLFRHASCLVSTGRTERPNGVVRAVVVPLPRYVQGLPDNAMTDAVHQVEEYSRAGGPSRAKSLLWRCLLVESTNFKQKMEKNKYPPNLRQRYARLHLPKFSWLIEFTSFDKGDWGVVPGPRQLDGEFIYDASALRWEASCISARIGNHVKNAATKGQFIEIRGPTPRPYCFISDEK